MPKLIAAITLFLLLGMEAWAHEHAAYSMARSEVIPITDPADDRQYELYVKLPEDYEKDTSVSYPVIYTTDAAWHMDMLSGATDFLMPNVILVGISWQTDLGDERAYFSRFRDYSLTPSPDAERQARYQYGQASRHLAFIRDHVITYVEARYRADPAQRTYFGYSLSAEFGAYTLFAEPDMFKNYILGSPDFNLRDLNYVKELEAKTASGSADIDTRVFLSIGELEGERVDIAKDFLSVLNRRSDAGLSVTGLEIIKASDHGESFPEATIRSIKWLAALQ